MKKVSGYLIHIQLAPAFRKQVEVDAVQAAARLALAHQKAPAPGALTVQLTSEAVLQRLNRRFLGEDHATDVLSFPSEEMEEGVRYFGDVAISVPRAHAQARAAGHPLLAELQLLVVHGVLHLLGHDHRGKRDKARMWAAQSEILKQLEELRPGHNHPSR